LAGGRKQEHGDRKDMKKTVQSSRLSRRYWKKRVEAYCRRIKSLQGDPHYVAVGMAAGVLVVFTPTIPFHNGRWAVKSCVGDAEEGFPQ
jgi:uncharacterized protein (DUF2062 family)